MGGITTITNKVKYIGIASLTIAILSVLTLNIISSYSSLNTNSNAEPVTQANGPLVSGPATISLFITSLTTPTSSPCDTSNSNICMKIPDDGGIATGGHTIKVSSNSYAGYNVLLSASEAHNDETSLVNTTNGSSGGSNSYSIPTTTGNLTTPSKLANNTWGYVLTNPTGQETNAIWAGLQPSTHKTAIATTNSLSNQTDNYSVYYGVKVDNPSQLLAGDYQTQVVYTAAVKLPGKPTITSVSPNQYELGSGGSNVVTTAGANLSSAYDIYLQSQSDSAQKYSCTNIQVASDGKSLTCTLPTNAPLGTYGLYITTQGGTGSLANAFSYTESLPDGMDRVSDDYGADGHVAVDYDENMIPVAYDETAKTWRVVTNAELQQNPKNWYNYTKKQWANALTVSKSSLQSFRDKQTGVDSNAAIQVDNNTNILGWWVYIPRYSYKVLRKEMGDHYAEEQNFEIVFETNKDVAKEPAACNSSNSNKYYQDCVRNQYGDAGIAYPGNNESLKNKTVWATHPAFTWQYTSEANGLTKTVERNGFWVGKFETTGTTSNPTVKPNQQSNVGNSRMDVDGFYDMAKSVGKEDAYNVGTGYTLYSQPAQNGHNLLSTSSHMMKNSEWGAVAYLSASKYGAGAGNVKVNMAQHKYDWQGINYDADGDDAEAGVTGCGPYDANGYGGTYYDSTLLNKTTIESTTACSKSVPDRSWTGSIGQLASTTNNVYGVYDMAGGASDRVAALYTGANDNLLSDDVSWSFKVAPTVPYIDSYSSDDGFEYDSRPCTWETCGGHALYETERYVGTDGAWFDTLSHFGMVSNYHWVKRGGSTYNGSVESGIFAHMGTTVSTNFVGGNAVRIVLLPAVDDAI